MNSKRQTNNSSVTICRKQTCNGNCIYGFGSFSSFWNLQNPTSTKLSSSASNGNSLWTCHRDSDWTEDSKILVTWRILYNMLFVIYLLNDLSHYSVLGLTPDIARVVGRMSEGIRIHISDTTKHLLDKLGGFRCEYRGVLDLGVSITL